jgi:hypothetical protein
LRSAAFSFGAMGELWRTGDLQRATYLGGVSGGSYAVTAVSMVRSQSEGVDWSDPATPGPYALGSPELDYLRNRTDYLAPGVAGRWNMFVRFVLGVAVNLAVVFGVALMAGVLLGRLYTEWLPGLATAGDDGIGHRPYDAWIVVGLAAAGLFLAVCDLIWRPSDDVTWRRLVRWSSAFLLLALASVAVIYVIPWLMEWLRHGRFDLGAGEGSRGAGALAARGVGSGLVALVAAGAHLLVNDGASAVSRLQSSSWGRRALLVLRKVLIAVLVPFGLLAMLLAGVEWGTAEWSSSEWALLAGGLAFLALFFRYANPITWSAQPFYKRRLRTVFCLKRHDDGTNPPTADAIAYGDEPKLSELRVEEWPQLLICAAANVSDTGLTPPGLSCTGFVFSADHVGGSLTGSLPTCDYESRIDYLRPSQRWWWAVAHRRRRSAGAAPPHTGTIRDVSPLSAVSISGAAVSPSMGRMNAPAARALITLLNLRLGVWLPNPRLVSADDPAWKPSTLVRPTLLFREMLGRNRLDAKFLYVSDGGHYENLGLVELLRRGCTQIVCIDAAGDPPGGHHTLGQAISLARAELGVEFTDLDMSPLAVRDGTPAGATWVTRPYTIGTYRFPRRSPDEPERTGTFVYIHKSVDETAPLDVQAYQRAHGVFPYDGTGDQFYDVEQFEAYRELGAHNAALALDALADRQPDWRAAAPSAVPTASTNGRDGHRPTHELEPA